MVSWQNLPVKNDSLVKSQFSPPLAGGDEGEGEIRYWNTIAYHPHPNPPPSRGMGFRTIYELIKNREEKNFFPRSFEKYKT
jgi:hypothetical protein